MNMWAGSYMYLVVINLSILCMAISSARKLVLQVVFLIFVFQPLLDCKFHIRLSISSNVCSQLDSVG